MREKQKQKTINCYRDQLVPASVQTVHWNNELLVNLGQYLFHGGMTAEMVQPKLTQADFEKTHHMKPFHPSHLLMDGMKQINPTIKQCVSLPECKTMTLQ